MTLRDHFSGKAREYARYRPSYPPELFQYLAGLGRLRRAAWDCATGAGQAALGLVEHFHCVVATDASYRQIGQAARHPRIHYAVSLAGESPIRSNSIDLVVVAQGLHWLDFNDFYGEVRRVARTGGRLAAWCYGLLRVTPDVDAVMDHFYCQTVGPYWPLERRHVEAAYRSIPFPFEEPSDPPELTMKAVWDLDHLMGYLDTWSSVQAYRDKEGRDPISLIAKPMLKAWGPPTTRREVRWPLHLRAGIVAG